MLNVSSFRQVVNVTGNQDICYYNFMCAHPLGALRCTVKTYILKYYMCIIRNGSVESVTVTDSSPLSHAVHSTTSSVTWAM